MTFGRVLAVAFAIAALQQPGVASASSFILDTGTPTSASLPVLSGADWYAAEFYAAAGETITQLSAYLTEGAGQPGNTFTWAIYGPGGTFLGRSNTRELPSFTTTGTFTANGWNSTAANYAVTTSGDYWVALQVSGASQTPGLDLPTESSDNTGTVPALAFAFASSSHAFGLETADPFGIEVSATPLPAAVWLLGSGLLGLGCLARRRRATSRLPAFA